MLLLNQPRRHIESAECLRAVQQQIPMARLALAVLYASTGETKRMREAVKGAELGDPVQIENWVTAAAALGQPAAAFGVFSRDE